MNWLLPCLIFAAWCVWVVACITGRAVADARRGIAKSERGGASIFPGIPIFPLSFWGVAIAIDRLASPWGSYGVGLLHLLFLMALSVSIVRDRRTLRELDYGE